MASRGVRYLIFLSRSGPRNESAYILPEELKSLGVQAEAPACDIAVSCDNLIGMCKDDACNQRLHTGKHGIEGDFFIDFKLLGLSI